MRVKPTSFAPDEVATSTNFVRSGQSCILLIGIAKGCSSELLLLLLSSRGAALGTKDLGELRERSRLLRPNNRALGSLPYRPVSPMAKG
jgi:hypothetical protein